MLLTPKQILEEVKNIKHKDLKNYTEIKEHLINKYKKISSSEMDIIFAQINHYFKRVLKTNGF